VRKIQAFFNITGDRARDEKALKRAEDSLKLTAVHKGAKLMNREVKLGTSVGEISYFLKEKAVTRPRPA
jgi:hypothetical protein